MNQAENSGVLDWLPTPSPDRANVGIRVGDLVGTYESFVRIFHPFFDVAGRPVSWRSVAEWSGKTVHAEAQYEPLVTGHHASQRTRPWNGMAPVEGTLVEDQLRALVQVLPFGESGSLTSCWWESYADQKPTAIHDKIGYFVQDVVADPLESLPARMMIGAKSPQFWWPSDRAWCVATSVDLHSTYLGCGRKIAYKVLSSEALETVEVDVSNRIDFDSDRLNLPEAR